MAGERKILVTFDGKDVGLKEAAHAAAGEIDKAGKGIGNTFADIGKAAAGFLTADVISKGFGMVTDFVGGSVQAYKDAAKADAQLEAVLKSTHGAAGMTSQAVKDLGLSLSKTSNYTHDAVQASSDLLLTFTQVGKQVFPDAQKAIVDMSAALGQDLQSSTIQLGKALNDPVKGITALKRVGVSFTADQQNQIKTMVKAGDTMGAQKLILKELNTEFGGSAEAAVKADGGVTQLDNSMKVLQENIGQKMLPVQVAFKKAQLDVASFLVDKAAPAVVGFGQSIARDLHPYIEKVTPVLKDMWQKSKDFVEGIDWVKIKDDVVKALKPVTDALKNDLLPALAQLADKAREIFEKIDWTTVWQEVGPLVAKVGVIIRDTMVTSIVIITDLIKVTTKYWSTLQSLWEQHKTLRTIVKAEWTLIRETVTLTLDLIDGAINRTTALLRGDLPGAWRAMWNSMKDDVAPAVNTIVDQLNKILTAYNNTIGRLPGMPTVAPVNRVTTSAPTRTSMLASFASGGIVSGPTLAMIGDNSDARSNPEVIAPLDQLTGMMGGGQTRIVISSGGSRLDDLLVEILRKAIVNGGGLATVFG
jgi:hypothetical protein